MGGRGRAEATEAHSDEESSSDDRVGILSAVLRGSSAEILGRLVADDPLRLAEFGARRMRARYFLFDPDRITERLMARVAHAGARARPEDLDRQWLEGQTDQVLGDLIEEDRNEEGDAPMDCVPEDPRYEILRSIWVEDRFARAASLAFNTLPESCRRAFYHLALEERSVESVLALDIWDEDGLHRDICRAIGALGLGSKDGRPELEWDGRT